MADVLAKLKNIRMLVLDVDGVLTDCRVFLDGAGEWRRFFSIRDGYGIVRIQKFGFQTAIITGTKAQDIRERARQLGINYFHEGHLEKVASLHEIAAKSGIALEQMAYIGDDDFDVPVLKLVGFAATVPDAMESAIDVAHYVTKRPGGNGAVREVCELLLKHSLLAQSHAIEGLKP